MEKIFKHIETLLRRHDYVIIPGFGGFVYQHQSAFFLDESIEPPRVTVSFNPLMNVSDGLLAIEFSRMEGVSFREASARISQEVEQIKVYLNNKTTLEFGNLGFLSSNEDEKIIFLPSTKNHLIPANYGLSSLHYAASVEKNERRVISFTLPPARKLIKYAAIGVIAIGLFLGAPKLNDASKNLANIFPIERLVKSAEVEEPVKPIEIGIPHSAVVQQEEAVVAQNLELKHHVIVSCMATQKDADELCVSLKNMNFEKVHILPPIKTFRVAIESFSTKAEAVSYMQQLRSSHPQFSDAWVLSE